MSSEVRKPAVAGLFYSADAKELHRDIQNFLHQVKKIGDSPKALIAPHAGYIYSGPIAAAVYARIQANKDKIKKVILLGPSHRVAFSGLALTKAKFYETPLGKVPLDQASLQKIAGLSQVQWLDQAHAAEHSLEVHVPFLQEILGEFQLVPIVVGDADAESVAEVIQNLWGGEETLVVISTDLSHFHDYDTARVIDDQTCHAIENLEPENIAYDQACGRDPVGGLLYLAKKMGLRVETVDVRNSGDTAGTKDRVVGYGAWAFYE